MAKTDFTSVSHYIAAQPEAVQAVLELVRSTIRKALPDAEEVISYQMAAYKVGGETAIYFAGWIREKDSLTSLETMALLNEALNNPQKADAFFKRAVLIGEQGLGGDHPEIAEILETYAVLLRNLKRPVEAAKLENRAKEIKAKTAQATARIQP